MPHNSKLPIRSGFAEPDPANLDDEAGRIASRPLTRRPPVTVHFTTAGRAALAAQRAGEDVVIHEARLRALNSIADSWAQALDAWGTAWLRIQQAGLERRTQIALLAEYEHLEEELRAFAERFHAEIQHIYDKVAALQQGGANTNVVQSRGHEIEMRLHLYHSFVSDIRDRFLAVLREHTK